MAIIRRRASICMLIVAVQSSAACAVAAEIDLRDHFWDHSNVIADAPGQVLRMRIDVTGDGVPEIMLAHSQTSGTSGALEWFVYSPLESNRYRLYGTITLAPELFLVQPNGPRVVVYYGDSGPMGRVVTYHANANGFAEEAVEQNVASDERAPEFAEWRRNAGLRVWMAGLDELGRGRSPNWVDAGVSEISCVRRVITLPVS